jgi:hypothetical protein
MQLLSALKYFPKGAHLHPQLVAASATITSTYVSAKDVPRLYAGVTLGALDSGTCTLGFLQAKTSAGGSAKALTAGGFAAASDDTDNAWLEAEGNTDDLDTDNGFCFVAMTLTMSAGTGGTGGLVAGALFRVSPDIKTPA